MEQIEQRKIDGLWLTVVGIAVLFFLILPTLIVIPMSFLWGLIPGVSTNLLLVSMVYSIFYIPRVDERH